MRVFSLNPVIKYFALPNACRSIHARRDSGRPWARLVISSLFLVLSLDGCSSVHCGKPVSGGQSFQASREHVEASGSDSFRIISWNLHGLPGHAALDGRFQNVANELLVQKPDVILFQEVWFKGYADYLEHALDSEYRRVSDPESLVGWFNHRKGGLLAFLRKNKAFSNHETSSKFYTYKEKAPWYRVCELDGLSGKGIQLFTISVNGRKIQIFNTHLQSPYPEYNHLYSGVRATQVDELLKYIGQKSDPNAIRFIFGDFNTRPGEKFLIKKTGQGWTDLTEGYRTDCHCATLLEKHKSQTKEPEWIDYGFVNRGAPVKLTGLQLIKNNEADCPYSDHQGLVFEFGLNSASAMNGN